MDSNMEIESVPCKYSIKKEGIDGVDIESHYDLTTRPEEFDCVVQLEPVHDPSAEDANSKIEIKSILDQYYVKEEADADNVQSSSLQDREEIKNEFEEKAFPTGDQTENEAGQNVEESDIKWAILDENHVEFKLESISDEEAVEDEIDEPDFLSFEDFNREQEDLDYKKNELNCDYNIIVKSAESKEKSKRHKCDKCSYQTENGASFIRHKQTHEARFNRNQFYCSTCGRSYFSKSHLKQHMVLHMDPKDRPTYNCDVCDYKTIYKFIIKKHKLQHAIRENPESAESKKNQKKHQYKCDKCSYQTYCYRNLRRHQQTHKCRSNRDLFECATCGRTYILKWSLEQHVLLHMDPKNQPTYNCDVCGYKTIHKYKMRVHKLKHAIKQNPKSVKSKNKRKKHQYKCDKCSYQSDLYVNLRRHEQTHKSRSDRDLFECATCGRTLTSKRSLELHMLLHIKHVIAENPKSAKSKKNQKKHQYKCDKCSYQTYCYRNLRRHEQTHKSRSDRDLFECATCDHTFTTKRSLEQHMLLHMDPKDRPMYDCDVCDYKTIYKSLMKKHKLMHVKLGKVGD